MLTPLGQTTMEWMPWIFHPQTEAALTDGQLSQNKSIWSILIATFSGHLNALNVALKKLFMFMMTSCGIHPGCHKPSMTGNGFYRNPLDPWWCLGEGHDPNPQPLSNHRPRKRLAVASSRQGGGIRDISAVSLSVKLQFQLQQGLPSICIQKWMFYNGQTI